MGYLKRRQLFVDRAVQGALLKRTVLYWVLSMATVFIAMLAWGALTGPARHFYTQLDNIWFHNGTVFVILTLLLPLFVADCIKLSNRFCGPAMRLRRAMHELANGNPVDEVAFRDSDYWKPFADEFNTLLQRVQQLERVAEANSSPQSESSQSESNTTISADVVVPDQFDAMPHGDSTPTV